jgi:von Willebrand factor type A domain
MQIVRTEAETGGPSRTPRQEIVPLFTHDEEVEPELYLDLSGSMSWEIAPPEGSQPDRFSVMTEAVRQFIVPFEQLDSQAAAEQASGSDEKGGVFAYGFNHKYVIIGDDDDDGDLNSSNVERKLGKLQPGGGTNLMEAVRAADRHFTGEFGTSTDAPARASVVFTDGEPSDWQEFGKRLEKANAKQVWAVAILGHGEAHDATLKLYQTIATTHPYVHVYSFDQVTNPAEIAEDMAVAVLPQGTKK